MRQALVPFLLLTLGGCVHHVAAPREDAFEPPPKGQVEVDILSDDDGQSWQVMAGREVLCTTPCTQRLDAHQSLHLESEGGDLLWVRGFGAEARRTQRAVLVAEGTHEGKQVNGIVFTTFGGMGVVVGTTFTAVGCSDLPDRAGLCRAGLITGGVSLAVTAGALWLLLDSLPKAHVLPVTTLRSGRGTPPVRVALVPTGVVGTF
jgi:hypothetical protein